MLAPEAANVPLEPSTSPAAPRIANALALQLGHGGVCLILELEPSLGVQVAARLNALGLANPVLVLPRWPYAEAVLPVNKLLHALITQSRRLTCADVLPNVVFVLDGERSMPVPRRPRSDTRADNRHRLAVADLPDLATLRAGGMTRVIKVAYR